MSFLFGKKDKKQNAHAQRGADPHNPGGSPLANSNANGPRSKERGGGVISPPPGANTSAHSIDDGATPSPEQIQGQRGRVDSDVQVSFPQSCPLFASVAWKRSLQALSYPLSRRHHR